MTVTPAYEGILSLRWPAAHGDTESSAWRERHHHYTHRQQTQWHYAEPTLAMTGSALDSRPA